MALVKYIVFDAATGWVTAKGSTPPDLFPPQVSAGHQILIVQDGIIPRSAMRVDRRKVRKNVTEVATLIPNLLHTEQSEDTIDDFRARAITRADKIFAARIARAMGPLAIVHAEKRRQAEAGGGAMVSDEADRLAILENAAKQDEEIADIERERRAMKDKLRRAATEEEIHAALRTAGESGTGATK